jgi:AcrR family transcriptional regulator
MSTTAPKKKGRRTDPEGRRRAVLEAASTVFAEKGFAGAKLDDVALEAGVGKGSIYLYFRDKQDLFEQLVSSAVAPLLSRFEEIAKRPDLPIEAILAQIFDTFRTEVLGTDRKHVLRLVIVEGARFPQIAEFYHREVIAKGMEAVRKIARRAHASGRTSSLTDFPQLVFAPLLMSVLWDGLFSKFDPLDVEGLFAAHRDILTRALQGTES